MKKVFSLILAIVLMLFVTSLAQVNAADKLTDYSNYLKSLSNTNPASARMAKDKYISTFANSSQAEKDAAFFKFYSYYYDLLNKLSQEEIIIDNNNEKATIEGFRSNGFSLRTSEGMYYIGPSNSFIVNSFSKYLSPECKDYLDYRLKEDKEGYLEDAGLVIPWDTMRERIIFIEGFLKKHPSFALKASLKNDLASYLSVYFLGVDNSPIETDYENPHLNPEVKSSYEKYMSLNKNSSYYPLVAEYYNMLKNNGFKVTDSIKQKIAKKLPNVSGGDAYSGYGFEVK